MRRNRAGFTMAEALTVMGIIVVLAAAAVPSGMGALKNVRQIQLNRSAETIYMTAQLNLVAAKVSSESETPPSRSPVTSNDSVTSTDSNYNAAKNIVLPANSISPALYAGHWVIEYSGWLVTTVYFSETETWSTPEEFIAWTDMVTTGAGKVGKYGA